jgi:acyl dehydratase
MADFEFPVDRTAILNFAAALGETNPIYWDEATARATPLGSVIAPPTFAVAAALWNPDSGLRGIREIPKRAAAAEATHPARAQDGSGSARLLHGEQRFEYHQPLRPGMRLAASTRAGRSWEKEGKRGGKLRFRETITELRDERGERVVTATSVAIVTEKAVEE